MRNRRFKSICFLILFAFFTVSLAGCGGGTVSTTTAARSSTKSSSNNAESTTAVLTTTVPVPTPPTPQIQASYSIVDGLSKFANGRAVVKIKDKSSDYYYGLIDDSGYLFWHESTKNFTSNFLDRIFILPDGYIVLAPNVMDWFSFNYGVLIIDKMGQPIFDSRLRPQGYDYIYLGYENGVFLLWEKYASFSSSETFNLCEMNTIGEITTRTKVDSIHYYKLGNKSALKSRLYGIGIITFSRDGDIAYIYNIKTHSLITHYQEDKTYLTDIYDVDSENNVLVYAHVPNSKSTSGSYYDNNGWYCIPLKAFDNKDSLLSALKDEAKIPYKYFGSSGKIGNSLINIYTPSEGIIPGIYKFNGEQVSAYPSNWNIKDGSAFSKSGYAFLYITGADKNEYFAVVNSSGEIVITPTLTNNNGRNTTEYEEALVKYKYTDVEENKEPVETKYQDSPQGSWKGWHYYKQDGSQLLTAYEVSNLSELLEYNVSPVNNSSQTNKDNVEKAYTSIKGFAITGTWKNTGSYTYGQAQSGAIIAFDGSRCNFFSPSDTYAFYAEDDHYRLDCTSPLGDTVSFIVRIIDENHIDIFNGQNIVELTRIVQ